jgi:tetratricopeptide (TPR) repeat protein
MKRTHSLLLGMAAAAGLLALAIAPAVAQQPSTSAATTGKIHGRIINPTGQPQGGGTVNLSSDGGATFKYTFPVSDTGDYTGEAAPGTYMLIYRAADTPAGKMVDYVRGIKIVAGEDLAQDDDMSRQEYIDKMTPEEKKQLEELKKQNAEAMKSNTVINQLNADLKVVNQDKKEIDGATAAATQALGATASKTDIAAKVAEIRTAKYTDIESLMTKDTGIKPDEALLWVNLGYGQAGLKKYDDAITSYKKAIDLETAAKKPRPQVIGIANAGLGEIYARTGKVPEANAAYDAAVKADPANAALNLRNEAIIFFQEGNSAAQVAAADEAIKVDPNQAILYYIKGQGLIQNATVDPKTSRIVLPPDCTAAYQKYLDLAPTGQFATEVAGILQQAGEKVSSSYKAPPKSK